MINKCLIGKASGFDRPRLALLQVLWGMITNANVDYADLIWEDFKFQIDSRQISAKKKELLPFPRFTKLIIKYILSHHNNVSKRPQSYQHVMKLDAVIRNMKFVNKGEKDPIYGMAILKEMMSDEIKSLARRLFLTTRAPSLFNEETLDHSTVKLNGVKNVSSTAQFLMDMKKARKASKDDYIIKQRPKGPGEGSSVVLDIHGDQESLKRTIPRPVRRLETVTRSMVEVPIHEENPAIQETQLVNVVVAPSTT
ncbi:hypothetical protein Tco_1081220 [Tanacetum coccineum]|uniref:Uncharacterized protein n=1 Tax=Tanacetum coccineum TaxID=301880 RepID=A0ABQ5HXD9_9ASTR